ncbi:hypothetical protein A1O3_09955 [Capronia epimyces CBS 606.96]|uniref:KOW domain-containing protein n=1 Tax=Capronia epimyces CBS 606.96 TaxID=1182542 RepID=W9XL76_9EURO|nr:uncharacterized protein A1O3_09955 [Capronia epimyces CBS 606.96]EXJ77726.1 hypothetical protein A1O3_09955 [Capronia epimyces CBS 606.96]
MQKVLRINLLARNQALKGARRKNLKKLKEEWADHDQRRIAMDKAQRGIIKDERRHRREDWIAGPLAPKRDVGKRQELYATVPGLLAQGAPFPERNIVEGDRVCVIHGKEELIGKIGRVKTVHAEQKLLSIEGLNMADIEIPEGTPTRERVAFQSMELPLPIDSVRLVHRLKDDETGRDRDVIVKLIRGGAPYLQREPYSPLPRHTRYIAGEDVEIPWPEVDTPTYQTFDCDTNRFDVESQSYIPSIYQPPLPRSEILDELRADKYARDREWHDDEYVRMKVLEDARAAWYAQRKLQSPLERLAEHKRKLAEKRIEEIKRQGLSDETMRIISEAQRTKRPRKQTALAD